MISPIGGQPPILPMEPMGGDTPKKVAEHQIHRLHQSMEALSQDPSNTYMQKQVEDDLNNLENTMHDASQGTFSNESMGLLNNLSTSVNGYIQQPNSVELNRIKKDAKDLLKSL